MKGIKFNDDMVRAILEGRKTQTRRPVKNYEYYSCLTGDCPHNYKDQCAKDLSERCPFGKVGDRLFVKETFCLEKQVESGQDPPFDDGRPIKWFDDGIPVETKGFGDTWIQPHYRSTDLTPELSYEDTNGEPTVRWKPAQNMPEWAARIFLEITEIRVERVQEISYNDCEAEGIDHQGDGDPCRLCFEVLWNSIYEKKGYGFSTNCFVWVISFKRVEG